MTLVFVFSQIEGPLPSEDMVRNSRTPVRRKRPNCSNFPWLWLELYLREMTSSSLLYKQYLPVTVQRACCFESGEEEVIPGSVALAKARENVSSLANFHTGNCFIWTETT